MNLKDMWETLEPQSDKIETIKTDLKNGLAPNLPYFIVGLDKQKEKISQHLSNIDTAFQYCILVGAYGNGKSNLMKYIEYYFRVHQEANVHVEMWRADVNMYDLNKFLLYIIQSNYRSQLREGLKALTLETAKKHCNNFEDGFSAIKEYVEKIIDSNVDDEMMDVLIRMGTGSIYSKRDFDKYKVRLLTDYNRHEVFAFFLNVLAANRCYILFCIDEAEKIQEKSQARFQTFLTSFRELIDMATKVQGHMIMVAMTEAAGNSGKMSLEAYNPAFARRIEQYTYELPKIDKNKYGDLIDGLSIILQQKLSSNTRSEIISKLEKSRFSHTSDLVISAYNNITNQEYKTWQDYVSDAGLTNELQKRSENLIKDDVMNHIHTKFFVPLTTYCEIIQENESDYQIKPQQYQSVYKPNHNPEETFVFLFTEDMESNINRLRSNRQLYPQSEMIVFKPENFDFSVDIASKNKIENIREVIPYNPIELMALLLMYIDDYENENLKNALITYMHGL